MGGHMFKDVEPIEYKYILPTVQTAKNFIKGILNISDNDLIPIGSTMYKLPGEFSGDIDFCIDIKKLNSNDINFILNSFLPILNQYYETRIVGQTLSIRFPIMKDINESIDKFCQVDLLFTYVFDFSKWFYTSATTKESQFKSAHKNALITSIIRVLSTEILDERNGEIFKEKRLSLVEKEGVFLILSDYEGKNGNHLKNSKKTRLSLFTSDPQELVNYITGENNINKDCFNTFEKIWKFINDENYKYKSYLPNIKIELINELERRKLQNEKIISLINL